MPRIMPQTDSFVFRPASDKFLTVAGVPDDSLRPVPLNPAASIPDDSIRPDLDRAAVDWAAFASVPDDSIRPAQLFRRIATKCWKRFITFLKATA